MTLDDLTSTTFARQRLTRKQLAVIQETVQLFPNLSRRELGHTVCEHLRWKTSKGTPRIQTCLNALEEMEAQGLLQLPAKQVSNSRKAKQQAILWTKETAPRATLSGHVREVLPLRLEVARTRQDVLLWNEYVDRYHYLHYRRPFGCALRYFIYSEGRGERLGCFLFSASSNWALSCRDTWIGWSESQRRKRLSWVVTNTRFLIFPWVQISDLASKSLSMAAKQLPGDWQAMHGYRPVLLETFVDPAHHSGTCYQAANWQYLGKSSGRSRRKSEEPQECSPKAVYVYPLSPTWKKVLTQPLSPKTKRPLSPKFPSETSKKPIPKDHFSAVWLKLIEGVQRFTTQIDSTWQKRRRVINTMLVVLFIFRLVFSKNKQGYEITLQELWDQCRKMHVPLPQPKPVAPSAMCNARKKVPAQVFKALHQNILETYARIESMPQTWNGRHLFAVDGTKIHLPRALLKKGYLLPSEKSYYPQGLVSCLYHLPTHIPYDFDLSAHGNERLMARMHLDCLPQNAIVVYDRGYFSYAMLYEHCEKHIDVIFRLQKESYTLIRDFFESAETERCISLIPSKERQKEILLDNPTICIRPLTLRLVKYQVAQTLFVLGTTLMDAQQFPVSKLSEAYHSRWGIEELYKISKVLIDVEDFHSQREQGVLQELYAHFVIMTCARFFTNYLEIHTNTQPPTMNVTDHTYTDEKKQIIHSTETGPPAQHVFKVNFKNTLVTIARNLEALFVKQYLFVKQTLNTVLSFLADCRQKVRPHRSYKRQSHKPIKKWRSSKEKHAIA